MQTPNNFCNLTKNSYFLIFIPKNGLYTICFLVFLFLSGCNKKNYTNLHIPAQGKPLQSENKKGEARLILPVIINQQEIDRVALEYATYKANVQKVVSKARALIGTRYQHGGLSPQGIDCSGLVYVCLIDLNNRIGRIPEDQSRQGMTIAKDRLQAGDLVFFGASKGSLTITHVGIVTEIVSPQKVLFVHASGKRGVVEDNFFHYHWQEVFVQAVRPNYYGQTYH
jgi:hypothetical protein